MENDSELANAAYRRSDGGDAIVLCDIAGNESGDTVCVGAVDRSNGDHAFTIVKCRGMLCREHVMMLDR